MLPTFPVPLFAAGLMSVLALHLALRAERARWLALLIGACAAQSLILALVQHYGLENLRPLQPIGATVIPPLAWIAFTACAKRPPDWRDLRHAMSPAVATVLLFLQPDALDGLIPLTFAGYGLARLRRARHPLPHTRLETGETPRLVWMGIGGALLVSALSDIAILAALLTGRETWPPIITSFVPSLTFLAMAWISLSPSLATEAPDPEPEPPLQRTTEEDTALVHRLDALLDESRLYLDPDLTLDRLARRMGTPRKTLSQAINRVTGENVSRFINARRISHACSLLDAGRSVTEAWLASGFNTKSHFNREFHRIHGCAPRAYRS